ncbi:MAG: rhodanese-like domain-containing protein [Thermoanaerobaculia bacterium]
MNLKRYLLETATLVGAAALCAFVANQAASRDRRLALPGNYQEATTVPVRAAESAPTQAPAPSTAAPSAPAPAENVITGDAPLGAAPPKAGLSAAQKPTMAISPSAASRATRTPRAGSSAAAANPAPAGAATPTGGAANPSPAREPLTKRFPPHPDKPYTEVTGADVTWLHARGALVLDARRTSVYTEGHIAGARPFSVWEADVDEKVLALLAEGRSLQEPVVIYCSGGDCEDSHMLSQKLFGAGFENVLVYHDGWPDWQKRGGASRTGSAP